MRLVADLHVHSRWSRATSKDADLAGFHRWARIKGIDIVGTGDFTHPRWFEELSANLVEDNGLYRLKEPPADNGGGADGPRGRGRSVRFMPTTEISSIYKKNGRVRKVHTVVCLPDLEAVRRLTARLSTVGNLASDGRPILGLDPRDLFSMVLDSSPDGWIIPAHVWTPWFSVFGSRSGFDEIEECFEELTPQIFALETGLSSDPPMNWRWSALDRFRLVSSSDAHSPGNLGREASLFDCEPSFLGLRDALRTGLGFLGTFEFYPEEGKYHFDGHRACGVCMDPAETARRGGVCPACGKPLTIGVLSRVLERADRDAPAPPRAEEAYRYIIPLPELLAELAGTGTGSLAVAALHQRVIAGFGSELDFLLEAPLTDIERSQGALVAEAVRRMREGRVDPKPGYDGEFGRIRVFDDAELDRLRGQDELFPTASRAKRRAAAARPGEFPARGAGTGEGDGADRAAGPQASELDADQAAILERAGSEPAARSVVTAGPGSGKTRLLVSWVLQRAGAPVLALTFTNRAAAELRARLEAADPARAANVTACTFHAFCWSVLREVDPALTTIVTPGGREALVAALPSARGRDLRGECARMELAWDGVGVADPLLECLVAEYSVELAEMGAADIGSLVARVFEAVRRDKALRARLGVRFAAVAVDELQDINRPQYELLQVLCAGGATVLAIGDPDQAIYAFRGSDRALFATFRGEPGTQAFSLTRNYRSTGTIVAAAEGLIAGEREPGQPPLRAARAGGAKIRLARAADPVEEGRFIGAAIRDLVGGVDSVSVDAARAHGGGTYGFGDMAVLFRTRAVRDALLPGLAEAGVPLSTGTASPLALDEPFRTLLALMTLAARPGDKVAQRMVELSGRAGTAPWTGTGSVRSLLDEVEAGLPQAAAPVPEVALGLETLRAAADDFGADLPGFLDYTATCSRESEAARAAQRVSLLTFHAAKGLEFPVVFVAGAEEGITPRGDEQDLAEERRLFYVAVTRARDLLVISHSGRRGRPGSVRACTPSRFLDDIPARCRVEGPARARPRDTQLSLFG